MQGLVSAERERLRCHASWHAMVPKPNFSLPILIARQELSQGGNLVIPHSSEATVFRVVAPMFGLIRRCVPL